MTEESPIIVETTPTPKKKRKILVPVIGLILVIAITGFVVSRAGLDKALVKQRLDDFAAQVKENGLKQGRDIDLSYGDLDVVGSFASKHVVVHNPVLKVQPLERKTLAPGDMRKTDSLVITSPVVEIYPEAADLSALRVELPQPINFAGQDAPEKSLLKISTVTPIAVSVAQVSHDKIRYNKVHFVSPAKLDFTYLREEQAKGPEDATPELVSVYDTLHVALADGSGIDSEIAADGSDLGTVKLNLNQITMAPQSAPEGVINIATIMGSWSNALNEKKQNVIHGTFNFGPVTAAAELLPHAPISAAVDVTYEGAMPQTPEAVASIQSSESVFALKTFTITTKESSLNATANFNANASDVLPVGTANLSITNAPFVLGELRQYMILNPGNEGWVSVLLQQITGTPVDQLKDVNIAIERTRGGSFKIGNTTFEELFAAFLKQALKKPGAATAPATPVAPGATAPAPSLPAADKPKAKPIALPDNSVRG